MKIGKLFRTSLVTTIALLLASLLMAITVSAKKIGADYTFAGFPLGWVLIAIAVSIGIIIILATSTGGLEKKFSGAVGSFLIVMLIIGLVMVSVDVGTTATTTTSVTWDVEINSVSGDNVTYDDDAGTITCLIRVNSTAGTIDEGTYTNPTINWTVSPAQTTGLTDLDLGATSTCYATNPDYPYTEDGEDYYLIAQSSGGKREVNFTNDGTSEYESKSVTVQFGSTEYVDLWIDWYDTGLATLEAGESKSFTVDICGSTYTVQVLVTEVST